MSALTNHLRRIERQITLVRPFVLALVLFTTWESAGVLATSRLVTLSLAGYALVTAAFAIAEYSGRWPNLRLPVWFDLPVLALVLLAGDSMAAAWILLAFVSYSVAVLAGLRWAALVAALSALAAALTGMGWMGRPLPVKDTSCDVLSLAGGILATFLLAMGAALVGNRQREHAAEADLTERLTSFFQVEHGVAESLRQALGSLADAFGCPSALLAFRDEDMERLFVWKVQAGQTERITPASLPLEKCDTFLCDDLETCLAWNSAEGSGRGFGWRRGSGETVSDLPRLPRAAREEHDIRRVMAAAFEFDGRPAGRILLVNPRKEFTPHDLQSLERVTQRLGRPLELLFHLRHLRARVIEAERGRVARDLHDGILQTLLSMVIRLDLLRRKLDRSPQEVGGQFEQLAQIAREAGEELREFVTHLRPVHVQSADLLDLMRGFAERFRHESALAVDLIVADDSLELPDRICRDLFQIYREALHNVKKHARANHVVVKLSQDEEKVVLVVDDNGQGFSFAGRFVGEELDRLRLGPISIKERTRGLGGSLTVESNPGHGARLTVEVPLN